MTIDVATSESLGKLLEMKGFSAAALGTCRVAPTETLNMKLAAKTLHLPVRALRGARYSFDQSKGDRMAGNSIKNKKKYKALKRKGMSKTRAAKIANAGKAASRKGGRKGGRKSKK